jgi:hypothetical protein
MKFTILLKTVFVILLIIGSVSFSAYSQDCQPKRIAFPKGSQTVILKGKTVSCNDYSIRLRRGQRMIINLTSTKDNAYFQFDTKAAFDQGLDFFCEDCQRMDEKITESGVWLISVFHSTFPQDKGATDYTLKITLK